MKQYITTKQWFELSKVEFYKLQGWMINSGYHDYDHLTIGIMIEFLDENKDTSVCIERMIDGWSLYEVGKTHKELCDALWEAVKEVLVTNH